MTIALEHVILGGRDNGRLDLLACSGDVPSQDPAHYRRRIELEPMPVDNVHGSQTVAMLAYDRARALLARAHFQDSRQGLPAYQYVLIPYDALSDREARLDSLLSLFSEPIPLEESNNVPALHLPPENAHIRIDQLHRLIGGLLDHHFDIAMTLLGAVIHERSLLIRSFPPDASQRLDLIQGIRALLPAAAAMRLTFSSDNTRSNATDLRLIFADDSDETTQWVYDWRKQRVIAGVLEHPYVQLLRSLWGGDLDALAADIKDMDRLSLSFVPDSDLTSHLTPLSARFSLDLQVKTNDAIETAAMIQALADDAPPQGRLRHQYMRKLLENALDHRDAAAGLRVAQELERDAALEPALADLFDDMLETQPDAVYVFIRNRLNHLGIDKKWLPRLQLAAANSLEVAIHESAVPTLVSWLELIAHEPPSYQLLDVLRQGILWAQPRARADGELGIHLILIATRRLPDLVDVLYADESLVNALTGNVSQALRDVSAQSLEALIDEPAEYFLLALFHGIQVADEKLVTVPTVKKLWSLYQSEEPVNLPAMYRPPALIHLLAAQASHQMTDDAIDLLMQHIIEINDTGLFIEAANHLADRDKLFPRLSAILEADSFTLDRILSVMNLVTGIDSVSPRDVMDAYFTLLGYYEWAPETQPMMEALARLMGNNPSLPVSYRHLWRHCETCNSLQIESATRVSINRLLQQFDKEEDPQVVVQGIARISKQIGWNKTLLAALNAWWRDYANTRTLMQLQHIEREMDSKRYLETQKQILRTAFAMRRLLHDRDPAEFAAAINIAYTLLENITDAFDAAQLTEIDTGTIRRQLDEVSAYLSMDEQHVLANNLRNLANRITAMADNRSKPSLIRSDDTIDRHLMLGESNPQGSIDMMKWIAGYLGGTHSNSDG